MTHDCSKYLSGGETSEWESRKYSIFSYQTKTGHCSECRKHVTLRQKKGKISQIKYGWKKINPYDCEHYFIEDEDTITKHDTGGAGSHIDSCDNISIIGFYLLTAPFAELLREIHWTANGKCMYCDTKARLKSKNNERHSYQEIIRRIY